MLIDLLRLLAINAVNGHLILILQTDICNAYMSIHPYKMMAYSLFVDAWFIKYVYILYAIKFMMLIFYFL